MRFAILIETWHLHLTSALQLQPRAASAQVLTLFNLETGSALDAGAALLLRSAQRGARGLKLYEMSGAQYLKLDLILCY